MLPFVRQILPCMALLAGMLFSQAASATFHLWQLQEIYSNASGTVQYIELTTSAGGQQFLSGHSIVATQGSNSHTFNFSTNLPGDSANRKFLIGTQGFADLGIVTPDYVVPNGFLFMPNGSVSFAGVDTMTYTSLPSNGVSALNRSGAVVTNAPTNFSGASGSITAASPVSYQDLWWNPNESGWGMSITQHNSMIFAAIYTYDQAGLPLWYVMSSCPIAGKGCSGDIYKVSGATPPIVPWNGSGKQVTKVGSGTLAFTDGSNGSFNFTIDGVTGSKVITRQIFASGSTAPAIDFTDLWWNPNESGWGVSLSQQFGMIFAAWYTYDNAGNPIWYVASSCAVAGNGCSGDLYKVSGGSPLSSAWTATGKIVVSAVGSVNFTFSDANNGSMSYTLDGLTGMRVITRQPF